MINTESWLIAYSFLGLVGGYFLSKISPEEMKPGKRYFNYGKILLLILMILAGIVYGVSYLNRFVFISAVIGLFLGLYFDKIFLILALGLSFISENILFASLIFIYGLLEGSVKYKEGFLWKEGLWFLVPSVLVLLFSLTSKIDADLIISLVIGYVLAYAYKLSFNR